MQDLSQYPNGELRILSHHSELLVGNPLGDPTKREIFVYLPPNYTSTRKYPTLLFLTGFSGTPYGLFSRDPFVEELNRRFDRLIATRACQPFIAVAPDCLTRFGGSQYLNSSATGNYEDYLVKEIVPYIQEKFPLSEWSVLGKSSGGYGAICLGLKYPEIFRNVVMHSGDCHFELCYLPDFGKALNAFRAAGGPAEWFEKFWSDVNRKRKGYFDVLNILAMAACYSPNPSRPLGIDFPFDLETGAFKLEVWERWQEKDPYHLVDKYALSAKKIKKIFIDCGSKDEFHLQWGARALSHKLKGLGAAVTYNEFEDGHMSLSYRYDTSLAFLLKG